MSSTLFFKNSNALAVLLAIAWGIEITGKQKKEMRLNNKPNKKHGSNRSLPF